MKKETLQRTASQIAALLLGGMMMLGLFGCGAQKYQVDYLGQKARYDGAKDRYRAGETVKLIYPMVATDTDYSFFLDDERLNYQYDDRKGICITFEMPAHDVQLVCKSRNSMIADPEPDHEQWTMLVDYYHATLAAEGESAFDEMVLSRSETGEMRLEFYSGDESREINVPASVADECYAAIEELGLREWKNLEETECLDGAETALSFREADGTYVRVSTDSMPSDGETALAQIAEILHRCAIEG